MPPSSRRATPWLTFLILAAWLATALPACDPARTSDDDDSAADDDDSTPLAACPAEDDAWEDNDDVATATPVDPTGSWPAVACPGDPDLYLLSVPNCRVLALSVSGPDAADLGLWLRDGEGVALSSIPGPTEQGGVGYEVTGTTWTEPNDDDDSPPPPRERILEVFAPDGTDGGLTYTLDVFDVDTEMCDE